MYPMWTFRDEGRVDILGWGTHRIKEVGSELFSSEYRKRSS